MHIFVKIVGSSLALAAIVGAAVGPAREYFRKRNQPKFRIAEVREGTYTTTVSATGEIKPVRSVSVGATVSGSIIELHADFNDTVEKGQLLAVIDPRIYQAIVASDQATLANRRAEVERVRVLLEQATRELMRSETLEKQGDGFISAMELDKAVYSKRSLAAQLKIAEATVAQAEATLENSHANLGYTRILSPVSGIVIDRKIDLGQTLASQFQTPELFVIAPEMNKTMHVYASIDEADIGQIRQAQSTQQPVSFRVDAYPDEIFQGKIEEIRYRASTTQNVVTYPVVVSAANPELKLMPGMTANLSFLILTHEKALMIPNSALRYFPNVEWVQQEDRHLIEGPTDDRDDVRPQEVFGAVPPRRKRHVWRTDGRWLHAVEVTNGESDHRFTEILEGDLTCGQQLVIGVESK